MEVHHSYPSCKRNGLDLVAENWPMRPIDSTMFSSKSESYISFDKLRLLQKESLIRLVKNNHIVFAFVFINNISYLTLNWWSWQTMLDIRLITIVIIMFLIWRFSSRLIALFILLTSVVISILRSSSLVENEGTEAISLSRSA